MVSVIIRNKNEKEYIGFAIQSVIDFIPEAEIIVLDNNSTDDSLDVVKLFNNRIDIRIFNLSDYSPGKALNLGFEIAKYDCVLVLSAHAQICKLNLQELYENLKTNVAVFGNQTPIYRGKKINKRYIWSHFGNEAITNMYSPIEDRLFLHNAFCFYDRQFVIEHKFDESLPGKEDRYWAQYINKLNYKYLYNPSFEANHYYTSNGATWKGIG